MLVENSNTYNLENYAECLQNGSQIKEAHFDRQQCFAFEIYFTGKPCFGIIVVRKRMMQHNTYKPRKQMYGLEIPSNEVWMTEQL